MDNSLWIVFYECPANCMECDSIEREVIGVFSSEEKATECLDHFPTIPNRDNRYKLYAETVVLDKMEDWRV